MEVLTEQASLLHTHSLLLLTTFLTSTRRLATLRASAKAPLSTLALALASAGLLFLGIHNVTQGRTQEGQALKQQHMVGSSCEKAVRQTGLLFSKEFQE